MINMVGVLLVSYRLWAALPRACAVLRCANVGACVPQGRTVAWPLGWPPGCIRLITRPPLVGYPATHLPALLPLCAQHPLDEDWFEGITQKLSWTGSSLRSFRAGAGAGPYGGRGGRGGG